MLRVGQNYLHNCLCTVSLRSNKEFNDINNLGSKFYTPYFILVIRRGFIPHNIGLSSSENCTENAQLIHNQSQLLVDNKTLLHICKDNLKSSNIVNSVEFGEYGTRNEHYSGLGCVTSNDVYKFKSIHYSNIFLGIKVSRKVGKANLRNKIKRRIKHLVRLIIKKLKPNNYGMIFIPRKNLATAKFELLVNTIDKLLAKYYS